MSGTFVSRINRTWDKSQSNITVNVFFWDWLKFIDAHTGLSFIAYGTGASGSTGDPPSGWLSWDPVSEATPWSDNSWVVFQCDNASATLNGAGNNPWQMKLQVTTSTAYSDPSGSDYGFNASTYVCVGRLSVDSGWDNATPYDFDPVSGSDLSSDMGLINNANDYYWLDIFGDDDTIYWRGSMATVATPAYSTIRGGYVGMIQRRNTSISKPFYAMIGEMKTSAASSGDSAIIGKRGAASWQFRYDETTALLWPSYSLGIDGLTKVSTHKMDTWHDSAINDMCIYPYTGEEILLSILLAQYEGPKNYNIIGELRFMAITNKDNGEGVVFGTNSDWIQTGYQPSSWNGVAMTWPVGEVPTW